MSVSKPTFYPLVPLNRKGTQTGRFDSRRPNVSQSPRSSSNGFGSYYDSQSSPPYYEDNSSSFGNDNCEGNDSGSSDSGSE